MPDSDRPDAVPRSASAAAGVEDDPAELQRLTSRATTTERRVAGAMAEA